MYSFIFGFVEMFFTCKRSLPAGRAGAIDGDGDDVDAKKRHRAQLLFNTFLDLDWCSIKTYQRSIGQSKT